MFTGLAGKVSESESKTIHDAVSEVIKWLEKNPDATPEELKALKKELSDLVEPIVSKLYQQQGGPGGPGGHGAPLPPHNGPAAGNDEL